MKITFHGQHNSDEATDSVSGILKLFKERYGIEDYREINLNVTLVNHDGEEVELVDASTSDVLDVFEVYKNAEEVKNNHKKEPPPKPASSKDKYAHLTLVVDNTRKAF